MFLRYLILEDGGLQKVVTEEVKKWREESGIAQDEEMHATQGSKTTS